NADCIGGRLPAAMTEVDQDPQVIHAFDGFDACLAESGVGGLEATVAEEIATIVGRLNHSYAKAMKVLGPPPIGLEPDAVMKPIDDARARAALGLCDIRGSSDARERLWIAVDLALIPENALNSACICGVGRRRSHGQDRRVCARQTGVANILHV